MKLTSPFGTIGGSIPRIFLRKYHAHFCPGVKYDCMGNHAENFVTLYDPIYNIGRSLIELDL